MNTEFDPTKPVTPGFLLPGFEGKKLAEFYSFDSVVSQRFMLTLPGNPRFEVPLDAQKTGKENRNGA